MSIKDYSTTPANNDTAGSVNFAEGQNPSTVNDSMRQVLADVREWYEEAQWVNLGHTGTYVTATTFTIATDVTATYEAGRAIRINDNGTIRYAKITSASYGAPNTTVTVSSLTMTGPINAVSVGALTQTNDALPDKVPTKTGTETLTNKTLQSALGSAAAPSYSFTGDTNTGVFSPGADTWAVSTGGTEAVRVSSTGDVGIGVIPSSWGSSVTAVQAGLAAALGGHTSVPYAYLSANAYNDGTDWRYITTNAAMLMTQAAGNEITWYSAGSGTAGNIITFSAIAQLGSSGQLALPIATGTSPFSISSTTVNTNLNADMVDGYHAATAATASTAVVRDSGGYIGTVPTVSGFTGGAQVYIESDHGAVGTSGLDVSTNIGAAWESVGPTGSGATNILADMDNIPAGAKAVIVKVNWVHYATSAGASYYAYLWARKTGSTATNDFSSLIAWTSFYCSTSGSTGDRDVVNTEATIPIDSSRRFDLYFGITASSTADANLRIVGFIF